MNGPERSAGQAVDELCAGLPSPDERAVEEIAVAEAAQRVLAQDLVAAIDLPPFDNAAMDGYALRARDGGASSARRIVGHAHAGHAFDGEVGAGDAVRILTGAPLPAGADAIVVDEQASVEGERLLIAGSPEPDANVRRRGEHVRRGEHALARGRRLRASDIGLAASLGVTTLRVFAPLRIGLLSTGDELSDAPSPLPVGGAFDGNRPFLRALLARSGCIAVDLGIAGDSAAALEAALGDALGHRLDAVVTSGGAALGDADFIRRHGSMRFVPVDFRPGRGIVAGTLRGAAREVPLFGLPGNAVAAYLMFQLIVRPLLGYLAGAGVEPPLTLSLPLAAAARCRPGRIEWRRARWQRVGGELGVAPLPQQGSAMLRTVSEADALVAIGPREHTAAGERVPVIPLAGID